MPMPVASAALAAALVLTPAAIGHAPALAQDFSITNQREPPDAGRRDVMRQLQAWWEVHAYYPRHASQSDEAGTVKLHLLIYPDGRIWKVDVVESSGSSAIDAAATSTFRAGFVRPFPEGAPDAEIDLSLHYVLAHRHDQPVPADFKPVVSRRGFTITNDPVRSPILETMMQRRCTGSVVKQGIRNHPAYGSPHQAQAVFFRRPDGTPWVRFYEGGENLIAPVNEVGRMVQWTGRAEHPQKNVEFFYHYTVWPDGEDKLSGNIEAYFYTYTGTTQGINTGGTVDFTCATEAVPPITWTELGVNPNQAPPDDPP